MIVSTLKLQKVLGVMLLVCLVVPSLFMNPNMSLAAGSLEVVAGNIGHGNDTNMVVKVTLGAELHCASDSYLYIVTQDVIGADDMVANDGNVVLEDGSDAYMSIFGNNGTIIGFRHNDAGCVPIAAGTVLLFYLGPADDSVAGYVTGEPDYFNPLATHVFTNVASGNEELIHTSGTSNTAAENKDIYGYYSLVASVSDLVLGRDDEVEMKGTVDPYISFSLDSDSIEMETSGSSVVTGTVDLDIATNAKNGYVVQYRSTALANTRDGTDVFTPITTAAGESLSAGVRKWGLKMGVNSTTGKTAEISTGYDGVYKVYIGNVVEILKTDPADLGPSSCNATLTVGASTSGSEIGRYESTVTFNVYASF